MPYIVHSRAERALHISESVFRIRCIAHDSHLITKSVLPNSCARNDSYTSEEHASNISELRHVSSGDANLTVFITQQPSPAYAYLLVYIEFFPLAHKTGNTLRSSSHQS